MRKLNKIITTAAMVAAILAGTAPKAAATGCPYTVGPLGRQRNKAENAAARRLQAAGYRLEGWDPRTGQRIAAQITGENTNDERRTFYSFPTWQDAAAALLD